MVSVAPNPTMERIQIRRCAGSPKRILVVDDHPAMRAGLRDLLADEADFDVIGVTATAEAALAIAEHEEVDVAVVDYQLDGRNGLWLSRKLKRLASPPAVLIYSAYTDGVLAAAAVVAEADAIVSKATLGSELCDAVRSVAAGRRHMPLPPPGVAESLRRRLDDQEVAIFGMLLAGIAPAEVASMLDLPAGRMESMLWAMLRRLEGLPEERAQ